MLAEKFGDRLCIDRQARKGVGFMVSLLSVHFVAPLRGEASVYRHPREIAARLAHAVKSGPCLRGAPKRGVLHSMALKGSSPLGTDLRRHAADLLAVGDDPSSREISSSRVREWLATVAIINRGEHSALRYRSVAPR